ncbi:MAG TPA: heme peroxidase family protein [Herpetosiphonaceae bacterium]
MSTAEEPKPLSQDQHDPSAHARQRQPSTQSRRNFLVRSSMLLAAVGAGAALEPANAQTSDEGQPTDLPPAGENKHYHASSFGRMFPQLPPFAQDTPEMRAALFSLGAIDGPMDGKVLPPPTLPPAPPASPPPAQTNDVTVPVPPGENPRISAGFTFFGQFIAHDLTFDAHSNFTQRHEPAATTNFRTPLLDLDSIYGAGPVASAHLYDKSSDKTKFLVDAGALWDLPRNSQGVALISDPRGDQTVIAAQLFQVFLRFHNAVVDELSGRAAPPADLFAEAQRLVRWHYQWLIVHEYLPHIVTQELVDDILSRPDGRRFYKWHDEPFMPVEFAEAAFRFGHSQLRPNYLLNGTFASPLFVTPTPDNPHPVDLTGGKRDPRMIINWQIFFRLGSNPPGFPFNSMLIDTLLPTSLLRLPFTGPDRPDNPSSLARRTLLRHLTFGVPSGQSVARAMNIEPLDRSELADLEPFGLAQSTPLWFYVLREAARRAQGQHLGPLGGRIVAEVIIGLLQADPRSYLAQNPQWRPVLGQRSGEFGIADLLRFAGAG